MRNSFGVLVAISLFSIIGTSDAAVWSDGFESGDFSGWNSGWSGVAGSVVASADGGTLLPRSGSYMMTLGDDTYGYNAAALRQSYTIPLVGHLFTGYMTRTNVLSSTPQMACIGVSPSSGNHVSVRVDESGNIKAYYGSTAVDTGLVLSAHEWLKVSIYAGTLGMQIYINDILYALPGSGSDYWNYGNNIATAWAGSWWGNCPNEWYYDDFSIIPVNDPTPDCRTSLTADLNKDCHVNFEDVAVIASQWMKCFNPADSSCDKPWEALVVGRSQYIASVAPSSVSIDGNLSEWPTNDYDPANPNASQWVAIDQVYYGYPYDYSDAFLCLMYSPVEDVLYGVVTVKDNDGVYGYGTWNTQDNLEVYIQGNANSDDPEDPRPNFVNAQQILIGLNSDLVSTELLWGFASFPPPVGSAGESYPLGVEAVVKRTVIEGVDHMVYEFKVVPYENYGGFNSTTTVKANLQSGAKIGFDVVLCVKSAGFGMVCPNGMTSKFNNVKRYATITCE